MPKNQVLQIRLSDRQAEQLARAAELEEKPVSTWARDELVRAARAATEDG